MADYEIPAEVWDGATEAATRRLRDLGWTIGEGDARNPDVKSALEVAASRFWVAAYRAGREQVLEAVRQLIAPESAMGATPFGGGERWFAELDIYDQVLARDYAEERTG